MKDPRAELFGGLLEFPFPLAEERLSKGGACRLYLHHPECGQVSGKACSSIWLFGTFWQSLGARLGSMWELVREDMYEIAPSFPYVYEPMDRELLSPKDRALWEIYDTVPPANIEEEPWF